MWTLPHAVPAFLLVASLASAAPSPATINLSWDQCAGDGRVDDRTFSCDTNTGTETLVFSIVLNDSSRTGVNGWEAWLDVTPVSSMVPPWWSLATGGCRPSALSLQSDWSGLGLPPSTCLPWYGGEPALAVLAVEPDTPDRFHVRMAGAVASAVSLAAGQEYAIARIRISHAKTTGTGACPGCQWPACLGISRLNLVYADPHRPRDYFAGSVANAVTWQDGFVAAYYTSPGVPCSEPSLCPYQNQLTCSYPPVPARPTTWGTIKSMYH